MNPKVQENNQELSQNQQNNNHNPIIQVGEDVPNQYLDEHEINILKDPNFTNSQIGNLYSQNQNIISLNFEENTSENTKEESNEKLKLSQFIFSKKSESEPNKSNALFQLQSKFQGKPTISEHLKKNTIKIVQIENSFSFIEPLIFSAFLYSRQEKSIITDIWNFYPEGCENFIKEFSPTLKNLHSATFEVDSTKDFFLFIFVSHPVYKDRGQSAINYYMKPNSVNEQLFQKEKAKASNQPFPAFATFCYTFFSYNMILQNDESHPLSITNFYITDKMLNEGNLHQLTSLAYYRVLEKMPIKLRICKANSDSELTIPQIRSINPYVTPTLPSEAILRLDTLTLPTSSTMSSDPNAPPPPIDCGYLVKVECRNNDGLSESVRSKFDPFHYVQFQASKLCYPPTDPYLNESFGIWIPFQFNFSSSIILTIYKCNFLPPDDKGKDKSPFVIQEVGSQTIPLIQNQNVEIDEAPKTFTFPGDVNLTFRLFLLSNSYTSNRSLSSFLAPGENTPFSLLQGVQKNICIKYLYSILNKFILKLGVYNDQEIILEFIKMFKMILSDTDKKLQIDLKVLNDFLYEYVRFFAFTPEQLLTLKKPPMAKNPFNSESFNEQQGKEENQADISNLQLHQKLIFLMTSYIVSSQTEDGPNFDLFAQFLDFFFLLIIKYITVNKSEKCSFGPELENFISEFSKCVFHSKELSKNISSFAVFAILLFDSGHYDASVLCIKRILSSSWPETTPTNDSSVLSKSKNDFIELIFRPSLFSTLIQNSKDFKEIVIELIRDAYNSIDTSLEPSRLFDILLELFDKYDTNTNQMICSQIVEAANYFQAEKFQQKDLIFSPCVFFIHLLVNSKKMPFTKRIFDGLHFLLKKVSTQNNTSGNGSNVENKTDPSQKDPNQSDFVKRRLKKSSTFSIKKKGSDLIAQQTNQPSPVQPSKDSITRKLFMEYVIGSIYELIVKAKESPNIEISLVVSLIFHLLIVHKDPEMLRNLVILLDFYVQRFKMRLIETKSPALVRILVKLFRLSISTTEEIPGPPSSSRGKSRAISFTAPNNEESAHKKSAYNEAPVNTSYRKNYDISGQRISPSGSICPATLSQEIPLSKLYESASVQLPSFEQQRKRSRQHLSNTSDSDSCSTQNSSTVPSFEENISPIAMKSSNEIMDSFNEAVGELINSMFLVDFECNKNNNRSSVILIRAMSSLDDESVSSLNITNLFNHILEINESKTNNQALFECVEIYKQISEISNGIFRHAKYNDSTYEEQSELLFKKFKLFSKSPDAQVDVLEKLYNLHIQENYNFEAASVSIVQASIIFENLIHLKKKKNQIPNYFRLSHPCLVFKDNCSVCGSVQYSDEYKKDSPEIPGFCDSFAFNEQGLVSLLYRALDVCTKSKIFKLAAMIIDLFWPIFEFWQYFNELQVMFSKFHEIFSTLVEDADDQDAFADRFFRVTFFGKKLLDMNQKTYIYRQNPLTHLYDFTRKIMEKYRAIYGDDNVVQISESGKVDTSKLDSNKIYIQITFVEPYMHGNKERENRGDRTSNDHYTAFFYDTPFVKSEDNDIGKAHQATMDKQWIRKTILTTNFDLPSLLIRSEVDPSFIVEKDLEPIKVVYKQIRDRTRQLEKAIESNDTMKTQQLLHGSLLVQVNEGPAKMYDIFLADESKCKSKGAEKLRDAFILFMVQLRKGVAAHKQFTSQNPEFQPLQEELEAGFQSLYNKLLPLVSKNSPRQSSSPNSPRQSSTQNSPRQPSTQNSKQNLKANDASSSSSLTDSQNAPPS